VSESGELDREERDRLVARIREDLIAFAPTDDPQLARERVFGRERFYQALAEYSDRLPRLTLSVCPYCEQELRRAIDPFGVDGPWWHKSPPFEIEEPSTCEHFQVLLGAYRLQRSEPEEARDPVLAGPDVPFVIPALLNLPGMVAVISQLTLQNGDRIYPIPYFSDQKIAPDLLHQTWLRDTYWFQNENGKWVWTVANDTWEFDLMPFLRRGSIAWIEDLSPPPRLHRGDAERCPYADLPGERRPQLFSNGKREWLELPSGETLVPFGEPPDPPPYSGDLAKLREEAYAQLARIAPFVKLTPEQIEELGDPDAED
jgi:hypothetical protein